MRKSIFLCAIVITLAFCVIGCSNNSTITESENYNFDTPVSEIDTTIDFGGENHFDHPVFLDETVCYTDLTQNEKLTILNDLKNSEIISAFVFIEYSGWSSFETDMSTSPDLLCQVKNIFLPSDKNYEIFNGTTEELGEYTSYVILTDTNGLTHTLFNFDYSIATDKIIGEFPNGDPLYETVPCSVIAYDGDYFLLRDVFVWRSIIDLNATYTEHYYDS